MDNNVNGGIGFAGFLALIFITLKLIGVIHWSWVWVLSPLWISLLISIVIIVIIAVIAIKKNTGDKKK